MTIASVGSASQTATIDTEHTLDTETTAGVYVLVVDTANHGRGRHRDLADQDEIRQRWDVKASVLSGLCERTG